MPGFTDNIKPSGKPGTYIVAIVSPIKKEKFSLLADFVYQKPWICKLLLRGLYSVKFAARYLNDNVVQMPILQRLDYYLADFSSLDPVADPEMKRAILVEFDESGKILKSWHSSLKSGVAHMAEGFKHGDHIYLGSFRNKYFGRIPYQH